MQVAGTRGRDEGGGGGVGQGEGVGVGGKSRVPGGYQAACLGDYEHRLEGK